MNTLIERLTSPLERLTSPLNVDAYLSTVSPLLGTRLRGVIHSVVPRTETAASIRIRPGRRWLAHRPGQFVTIGVDVDGVRHFRCYSLTSIPRSSDGLIEITVESASGGLVSTHLVNRARPGDVVQLSQAEGEFVLPTGTERVAGADRAAGSGVAGGDSSLLFVTGGSGITPVMGMLRSMVDAKTPVDAVVLHHSKSPARAIFGDELDALAGRFESLRVVQSYTDDGGSRLDADLLGNACPDWQDRVVYACGPAPLLDFVQSHWGDAGLSDRVHVEQFVLSLSSRSTGRVSESAAAKGTTRFLDSDLEVPSVADLPLLEVAESAGLAPAHGCRMGICHTCTTPLLDGCVTDLRDGRISEPGSHVQICVSAALGDVSLGL